MRLPAGLRLARARRADQVVEIQHRDDSSIGDTDGLLRRIPLQPAQVIWDSNRGCWRPTSAAFCDHPNGTPMSVSIQSILQRLYLPNTTPLDGYETSHALVVFPVSVARRNGQGVALQALNKDPAHAIVFGHKTKKVKRALSHSASWVSAPCWAPPTGPDALL